MFNKKLIFSLALASFCLIPGDNQAMIKKIFNYNLKNSKFYAKLIRIHNKPNKFFHLVPGEQSHQFDTFWSDFPNCNHSEHKNAILLLLCEKLKKLTVDSVGFYKNEQLFVVSNLPPMENLRIKVMINDSENAAGLIANALYTGILYLSNDYKNQKIEGYPKNLLIQQAMINNILNTELFKNYNGLVKFFNIKLKEVTTELSEIIDGDEIINDYELYE